MTSPTLSPLAHFSSPGQSAADRLFALSLDLLCVVGRDGRFERVNPAFERTLGWPPDALLARPLLDFVHPDDRAATAEALRVLADDGAALESVESRYLCADGSHRWLSWRASSPDDFGLVYAVARDITERRRTEEELRASEERYRRLVETSHDGICTVDAIGTITYANVRLSRMLGEEPGGLVGRSVFDLLEPPAAFEARTRFARQQRGIPDTLEVALRRRDGSTMWARKSASSLFDAGGSFAGAMYTLSDFTERRAAEQRLSESERHFRALTEQSSELVSVLDERGTIRYANPAHGRLLGHDPGEALDRPLYDLLHPDDVPLVARHLERITRAPGAVTTFECRAAHEDGSWRTLHTVAQNLLADPAVAGIVVNSDDVTERRAAEELLRRQKEMLQTIFDHIPAMVTLADASGRPVLANREWTRVSGWRLEETTDLLAELYPDADERARAHDCMRAATGRWDDFQMRVRDGRVLDTVWATVALSDGSMLGIGQDVTDRKQLEQQFRQAQKMEAVGRLAGGIAHDFNNLLSVIASYSGMVLAELADGDPARADLLEIQRAVDRAASLTRQLLAFSRQQVLQPRVVDLCDVVDGTQRMLRRLIGEDVVLVTRTERRPAPVKADPGQLEQVLMNLAVNARDAMPSGGTLTIAVEWALLEGDAARRLTNGAGGRFVQLHVTDTGCGMDEATRQRIFEPFFTTKTLGHGTGLGLATVYGIVKQSGGFIWVDSAPGAGTTFAILLPLASEPAGTADGEPPQEHGEHRPGATVLLVEDEPALRAVSRRVLEKEGYHVLAAADGAEAVALAERHAGPVHLLVSDVVMPRMSGQELVGRLEATLGEVPVLFMSGYAIEAVERHGVLRPGACFLAKPFQQHDFLVAVAEALLAGQRRAEPGGRGA